MNSQPSIQERHRWDPIAVTGYGLTTCLGTGVDRNWEALCAGRSGLAPIRRFDVDGYAIKDGGEAPPPPGDLENEFPGGLKALSYLAHAGKEALAMAGMDGRPNDPRAAMVVGSSLAAADSCQEFFLSYLARGPEQADYSALSGYYVEDHLARLGKVLGLGGPAMLISNACAAGGSSIARAVELLRAGRCDRVLAMGYDALSPFTHAGFGSLQALSRGTTRPFGTGRDGMKLGDGFAALHLERPGRSGRTSSTDSTGSAGRVVPMVLGYGESADAHHLTHPHPEGLGAALAMQRALVMAGLEPGAIDYINCHGTATPSNDRAEALALEKVFGEELPRISINASKPNFGHTLGGAGAVEAVVTLLALRAQQLPPTLNIDDVEPEMKSLRLVREGCRVSIKNGMSNSFGFGGCNVSLIFGLRPLTEGGGE